MMTREPAWGWPAICGFGLLYLVALLIFLTLLWDARRGIDVMTERLPAAMLSVERAIGYGGLIHNLENHVLRTDEGTYGTAAAADHDAAMQALQNLDRIAADAGLEIRTEDIRDTLDRYRQMIDEVDRANAEGLPTNATDEQVRVSDLPALQDLRSAHGEIAAAYASRIQDRQRQIAIMMALMSLLMLLIPAGAGSDSFW